MAAQKKQKNKAAAAAAMFAMTSMSSEELSTMSDEKKSTMLEDFVTEKENEELEKIHKEEEAEAKELGMDDTLIVESTPNEISKDFEQKLEESQTRYLEAVEDKRKAEEELARIKAENISLSSQLDLLKTDSSREIANYKVEMSDLNEAVSIYKANEINYKAEIASLKSNLHELEIALDEANKIINEGGGKKVIVQQEQLPKGIPMFTPKKNANVAPPSNGYSSWN